MFQFHRIDLISSTQYFLEVENRNAFSVDIPSAVVQASGDIGSTRVLLRDKNVELREDLVIMILKVTSSLPNLMLSNFTIGRNRAKVAECRPAYCVPWPFKYRNWSLQKLDCHRRKTVNQLPLFSPQLFKVPKVITSYRYDIFVDIFDSENRKLFLSANLVVSIQFQDEGYFDVVETVTNGTWISGHPLKPGNVQVRSVYCLEFIKMFVLK